MYKMKVSKAYMKSISDCVKCPKGQDVELPEDIAKAWLKHGFCERANKIEVSGDKPKYEKKIVNPVEETKAPKVRRKKNK